MQSSNQRFFASEETVDQKINRITHNLSSLTISKTCQDLYIIQGDIVKMAPLNKMILQKLQKDYEKLIGHLPWMELKEQGLPLRPGYIAADTALMDLKKCQDKNIIANTRVNKKANLVGKVISLLLFATSKRGGEDFKGAQKELQNIIDSIRAETNRLNTKEEEKEWLVLNSSLVALCIKSIDIAIWTNDRHKMDLYNLNKMHQNNLLSSRALPSSEILLPRPRSPKGS
jgi:hypothetical protein